MTLSGIAYESSPSKAYTMETTPRRASGAKFDVGDFIAFKKGKRGPQVGFSRTSLCPATETILSGLFGFGTPPLPQHLNFKPTQQRTPPPSPQGGGNHGAPSLSLVVMTGRNARSMTRGSPRHRCCRWRSLAQSNYLGRGGTYPARGMNPQWVVQYYSFQFNCFFLGGGILPPAE